MNFDKGTLWIMTDGTYAGTIIRVTNNDMYTMSRKTGGIVAWGKILVASTASVAHGYDLDALFPLELKDGPVRFDTWNVALKEFLE